MTVTMDNGLRLNVATYESGDIVVSAAGSVLARYVEEEHEISYINWSAPSSWINSAQRVILAMVR